MSAAATAVSSLALTELDRAMILIRRLGEYGHGNKAASLLDACDAMVRCFADITGGAEPLGRIMDCLMQVNSELSDAIDASDEKLQKKERRR